MKIAVLGADSSLGSRIVLAAEKVGITVTSIVSSFDKPVGSGPIIVRECNELQKDELKNFFAIIDPISFPEIEQTPFPQLPVFALAPLLRDIPCNYIGIGSTYILFADRSRTRRVMDCDGMFYVKGTLRAGKVRELYEKIESLENFKYTLLCPPLTVKEDAYPTGRFELCDDVLPVSTAGESSITLGDLVLAMVELLKQGNFPRSLVAVRNS